MPIYTLSMQLYVWVLFVLLPLWYLILVSGNTFVSVLKRINKVLLITALESMP